MNNKVKRIGLILALVTARLSLDVISWKILTKYVIPIIAKVLVAVFFLIHCITMILLFLFGYAFAPGPEVPEITYSEFPFKIVYSIDGEVFEIEDSYVCDCKGVGFEYDLHKNLIWNTYLKNAETEYIELCDMHYGYRLCLYVGSPEYYMMESFPPYGDHVPGEYLHSSGNDRREEISFEEAKEKYGLEIISATFSEPIENKLEYRKIDKIRLFIYDTFGIPVD